MKLITLNIEGDKHLGRVLPFIKRENPDVLCLQEVFLDTLEEFSAFGYQHAFLPMTQKLRNGVPTAWGIAVCARGIVQHTHDRYYRDVVFEENDPTWLELKERGITKNEFKNGILGARVFFNDTAYDICATHFTWAPYGETASDEQISSMHALLAYTSTIEPHLLCGDFNIPRHQNALYEKLIEHYTDNVPPHYASSLDSALHRLGNDPAKAHLFQSFMVDYLFSQDPYRVSEVRLEFGVSDHAAVIGTVA